MCHSAVCALRRAWLFGAVPVYGVGGGGIETASGDRSGCAIATVAADDVFDAVVEQRARCRETSLIVVERAEFRVRADFRFQGGVADADH
eukprot:gene18252-25676_t